MECYSFANNNMQYLMLLCNLCPKRAILYSDRTRHLNFCDALIGLSLCQFQALLVKSLATRCEAFVSSFLKLSSRQLVLYVRVNQTESNKKRLINDCLSMLRLSSFSVLPVTYLILLSVCKFCVSSCNCDTYLVANYAFSR